MPPPTPDPVPDERPYTHLACGSTAVVSEGDFSSLTDPLSEIGVPTP